MSWLSASSGSSSSESRGSPGSLVLVAFVVLLEMSGDELNISGGKEVNVNHAGCVQLPSFRNKEDVLQMFPFPRVNVALLCCLQIRKHGMYTRLASLKYNWKRGGFFTWILLFRCHGWPWHDSIFTVDPSVIL